MADFKDIIENPHPIWKKNNAYWKFLLDSYEGGTDYTQSNVTQGGSVNDAVPVYVNGVKLETNVSGNLFKHKKERAEDYAERVMMSYYYNFCSPIVDIYTNHLFKEPVMEDFDNIKNSVEQRDNNIDRRNSSIIEFRRELSDTTQIFGHMFVVTDMPKAGNEKSLADRVETGMFPYFSLFSPMDVLNWALDEFGRPHWVLVRECMDSNSDPMSFDKNNRVKFQYRLWTRAEWVLINDEHQEVERGNHPLGVVPIDIIFHKPSKKVKSFMGISELADIAFIARDVYNKCSELNEIIRNQTFALLCLQGKSSDYDELSVGTSKAMLYPPETNVPQYVSPQADNARILMDQIGTQVTKMFQLAKLSGGSAQEGQETSVQSGISKAFDFHETNAALSKKAGFMEDGEMRMWNTYALWEGQKEFTGSIKYPSDFNVQDLNQDLDEAERLFKMQISQEFDTEIKKNIIKKKFPRLPEKEIKKMEDQITDSGNKEGSTLRSRLPKLFNNNNGEPTGNNGELK